MSDDQTRDQAHDHSSDQAAARARGAPPERHATPDLASTSHPSDAGDGEPPHGDPLRREVVDGRSHQGPPSQGTRHGADATRGRDAD